MNATLFQSNKFETNSEKFVKRFPTPYEVYRNNPKLSFVPFGNDGIDNIILKISKTFLQQISKT